jgi:hypothetical protein
MCLEAISEEVAELRALFVYNRDRGLQNFHRDPEWYL